MGSSQGTPEQGLGSPLRGSGKGPALGLKLARRSSKGVGHGGSVHPPRGSEPLLLGLQHCVTRAGSGRKAGGTAMGEQLDTVSHALSGQNQQVCCEALTPERGTLPSYKTCMQRLRQLHAQQPEPGDDPTSLKRSIDRPRRCVHSRFCSVQRGRADHDIALSLDASGQENSQTPTVLRTWMPLPGCSGRVQMQSRAGAEGLGWRAGLPTKDPHKGILGSCAWSCSPDQRCKPHCM